MFFDVFLCWLLPTWKNLGNHGPYLHHMGSWRCEKPRDPLDSTSKMTNVNRPRKPVGRGGWFTQVVETVGNVYVFFCQHTSHANSKSQESYGFFFHLQSFMLSCHFEPISNATIMGHFFSVQHSPLYLDIVFTLEYLLRLYDGNHITHCFGEFEGHQNQESPRKRCFFSKLFELKDWIGFCLG